MVLPEKACSEFQEIYRKLYGISLTKQEAEEQSTRLFNYLKVLVTIAERNTRRVENDEKTQSTKDNIKWTN